MIEIAASLFLALIQALFQGWALHLVWAWFVVRGLHAPPITTSIAAGLVVLVQMVVPHTVPENVDIEDVVRTFGWGMFYTTFFLLFAALFYWISL